MLRLDIHELVSNKSVKVSVIGREKLGTQMELLRPNLVESYTIGMSVGPLGTAMKEVRLVMVPGPMYPLATTLSSFAWIWLWT